MSYIPPSGLTKLIGLCLLTPSLLVSATVYQENGGLVVMEIENTKSALGKWVKKTNFTGYTGTGHLQFEGNSETNGPADSPLEFYFKINKAGLYYLHLHCLKNLQGDRDDISNDAYVRVEGDYNEGPKAGNSHGDDAPLATLKKDTKFFGGDDKAWAWASGNRLDLGGDNNKRVAVYDFKAGKEYTLVVSGRSKYFNINRIVFRHTDTATSSAQNTSVAESTTGTGTGGSGTGGGTAPATPAKPTVTGNGTATPTVSGTTLAGALVSIFTNGDPVGTVTAASNGSWTYTITNLANGTYPITVTAQNAGGTSAESAAASVTVAGSGGSGSGGAAGEETSGKCGLGSVSALLLLMMMGLFARKP